MAGPSYLPEAIPTALGWAHPLTGEQLDVTSGLVDAVDYYKPNAGAHSFLDPNGETEFLAFVVVNGLKAKFAVHTFHPIISIGWDWGDGSGLEVGTMQDIHVYEEKGTYTATATVTYLAQDPVGDPGDTIETAEVLTLTVKIV